MEKIKTIYGATWIDSERNKKLSRQLKDYGAHQRNELAMLLSFLKEGDIAIDIGGHVGTFAVPIAKKVGASGKVYVFEPLPENFQALLLNIKENDTAHLTPIQKALGDREGVLDAHICAGEYGGTSLIEEKIRSSRKQGSVSVPITTLDTFVAGMEKKIPHIDAIKIDVEGMEYKVLLGGKKTIKKYKPILYFEISEKGLVPFFITTIKLEFLLRKLGYSFFKNLGDRNSSNDRFVITRVPIIPLAGRFCDVLAVPKNHPLFPHAAQGPSILIRGIIKRKISQVLGK